MKFVEGIINTLIGDLIDIDEMQFAFVPGRVTTDAIFIVRQLQENYLPMKYLSGKNLTL